MCSHRDGSADFIAHYCASAAFPDDNKSEFALTMALKLHPVITALTTAICGVKVQKSHLLLENSSNTKLFPLSMV